MLVIQNTNWSDAFTIMGLGMLIVFVVLTLLVFLLNFSGFIFNKIDNKTTSKAKDTASPVVTTIADIADENEKAAIAMALYLYYEDVHDEESYVITIETKESSWNSKLYNINNIVN